MNESESKNEKPQKKWRLDPELLKKGLRCDLDQYEMLKLCSDNKDMTEWNKWRKKKENRYKDIELEGQYFRSWNLETAHFSDQDAFDREARFFLKHTNFRFAHMERAVLHHAYLKNAKFNLAHLQGADLHDAHLEGAIFYKADIRGASIQHTIVDGETSFWKCKVDRSTNFEGTAMSDVRIDPGTKQLLEYNIRRMNWESWYKYKNWQDNKDERHIVTQKLMWFIRRFWEISDYGISTKQIIRTFFKWALVFAAIYYAWGFIDYYFVGIKDYPGIVSDLFVLEDNQEAVSRWLVPFRAVYFSIVTMTTLGLGDMYANAHSFLRGLLGHTLLALQVILGYVLLGALVTRFAVLFTAGGPAGKFSD